MGSAKKTAAKKPAVKKAAPKKPAAKKPSQKAPKSPPKKACPAPAPTPTFAPRAAKLHRLVNKKGGDLAVYDAVSVAQFFARAPDGVDAEVARSVYVYPYGETGVLHRFRVDAELLAAKPAKHKPLASTAVMNEHLENDDSYRPCHALSSDGRELYVLRHGKARRSAELLALDPITLELLRPLVPIATTDQLGFDGPPVLPAGKGRVLVRANIEKRKGALHLLDAKTGAVLASRAGARHLRVWHPEGSEAPYAVLSDAKGLRVFGLAKGSFEGAAVIVTGAPVEMLDVGPANEPGAFTVHALLEPEGDGPLVVKRYLVRPASPPAKRVEPAGDFLSADVMFATHLPQSISGTFDGRLLAVVGGNFATTGLWEWFGPGLVSEETIVATDCDEDGRVFRVVVGDGAALAGTGQLVLAPRLANA